MLLHLVCVNFTHIIIIVSHTYGPIMNMKVYMLVKYACCSNSHSLFSQVLLGDGSLRCYFNFPVLGIQEFYFNKLHRQLCSSLPLLKEMPKKFSLDLKACYFLCVREKVLRYKSEGRWFDSRWCHWNFSLT